MDEIVVRFPARHKALAMAVEKMKDCVIAFESEAPKRRGVDYRAHERALAAHANEIERQAHGISLAALDVDAERILIDGVAHVRVLRADPAEYKTRVGPVPVVRSLFRPEGKRNAKTVNTVTLRARARSSTSGCPTPRR